MALALANTEFGRLAIEQALRSPIAVWPYESRFLSMLRERWPCFVHYVVGRGVAFTPPTRFYFLPQHLGPTDCVWIVPGTL